jgi:hypothetical protein
MGMALSCRQIQEMTMAAPEYVDGVNASGVATALAQTSVAMAQGLAFASEMSRQQFLRGIDQVGTREAQAMQEVRADRHAREILAQNAVAGQPKAG